MINNDSEPALNPELAKKHACELQELYETALRGEGEDSEGDEGVQVGEDDNGDEEIGRASCRERVLVAV